MREGKKCVWCGVSLAIKKTPWESDRGFTGRSGYLHPTCAAQRVASEREKAKKARK